MSVPSPLSRADAGPVRSPGPAPVLGVGRLVVVDAHRSPVLAQVPRIVARRLVEHEGDLGVAVLVGVVRLADEAGTGDELPLWNRDDLRVGHAGQVPLRARGVREAEADGGVAVEPVAEPDRQPEVVPFLHELGRLERRDRLGLVVVDGESVRVLHTEDAALTWLVATSGWFTRTL